jgi:CRISPR/Cas system CSM-associated protein Csm5 (group 7 of RAMP superfamily)
MKLLFVLLFVVSCAYVKKVENDFKSPEIMSKSETDDYMQTKLTENNFNFRNCLTPQSKKLNPYVQIHFKIEQGVIKKSEASGARLPSKELQCLTKEARKMEFMMIKNYDGKQSIRI